MELTLFLRLAPLLGILVMLAIAYLASTDRAAVGVRVVAWGLGLQFVFALLVLRTPAGRAVFEFMGRGVNKLLSFAFIGSEFVFGNLGAARSNVGFVFAFQVLPTIVFIAALFAILYYLGIMQVIVAAFARLMTVTMKASGAESLNVAASIFMGQTEAPLTVRPFLNQMTRSELMCVMTSGMAHVSGGIMAAYIAFGVEARHLLTAVIMTAPGTIMISKILVPETDEPKTRGKVTLIVEKQDSNILDATARGTIDGLHLALNVAAMLISFLAIIALINYLLGLAGTSLQQIFGWVFAPFAFLVGIPWKDATQVGGLMGTRMVLNELIAFSDLGQLKGALDPRSFTIATFALCGFANFSSIGIQIGGIGALAPERKHELAQLGFRAMIAGTMANFISACIAAILL
ncbi:MAG: NupC/NupG family nucleoside CNT transporter [Acidobacteria bacterium]|nr:NupC/NupG family nucleoside CNT transporter [Acidobacteriota bacterium]